MNRVKAFDQLHRDPTSGPPHRSRTYCSTVRPATAIVILILLAVIVIAGVFQLQSILAG